MYVHKDIYVCIQSIFKLMNLFHLFGNTPSIPIAAFNQISLIMGSFQEGSNHKGPIFSKPVTILKQKYWSWFGIMINNCKSARQKLLRKTKTGKTGQGVQFHLYGSTHTQQSCYGLHVTSATRTRSSGFPGALKPLRSKCSKCFLSVADVNQSLYVSERGKKVKKSLLHKGIILCS